MMGRKKRAREDAALETSMVALGFTSKKRVIATCLTCGCAVTSFTLHRERCPYPS